MLRTATLLLSVVALPSLSWGQLPRTLDVDIVRFTPTQPVERPPGPVPGVWVDTNVKLTNWLRGTVRSRRPYGLAFDYTDPTGRPKSAVYTKVEVAYDDGVPEPALENLELPVRITGRTYNAVNSTAGGRVVRSKLWIVSGRIPDVITRAEPFTLRIEGYFSKADGGRVPFEIEQHFDVARDRGKRPAADLSRCPADSAGLRSYTHASRPPSRDRGHPPCV